MFTLVIFCCDFFLLMYVNDCFFQQKWLEQSQNTHQNRQYTRSHTSGRNHPCEPAYGDKAYILCLHLTTRFWRCWFKIVDLQEYKRYQQQD